MPDQLDLSEIEKARKKNRLKTRKYRARNREKMTAYAKKYNAEYAIAHKVEIAAQRKEHYEENREKILEYYRNYRRSNRRRDRAKIASSQHKYYMKHRDAIIENKRIWAIKNPERSRRNSRKKAQMRIARKNGVAATLTNDEWEKILADHFYRCHYCGVKSDALQQDHKIPVSAGGGYTANNIVPACKSCNSSKGKRDYGGFVKGSKDRLQGELF